MGKIARYTCFFIKNTATAGILFFVFLFFSYLCSMLQHYTLSALQACVAETIADNLGNPMWVEAELASVSSSTNYHAHCYMELVEKSADGSTIVAQARACCWAGTWQRVGPAFAGVTGSPLKAGMKVLLLVRANFHARYGFSWTVGDIDATFTIGDMARRRQEILAKLRAEGVIDLNKSLRLSPFARRVAVVSSATAAGYGDFIGQLQNNTAGVRFDVQLFPAMMQGQQTEATVTAALTAIASAEQPYDVAVIIRGGGSTTDLSDFDTLALAEHVAQFPLPVIVGIGHDRDRSVLDEVAAVSVKTPTAAAEYLIDNLATTLARLDDDVRRLLLAVGNKVANERTRLAEAVARVQAAGSVYAARIAQRFDRYDQRLAASIAMYIERQRHRLDLLQQRTEAVDPVRVLKRGYSITTLAGHVLTDADTAKHGDKVKITLAKGEVEALVQ